MIEAAAPAPAAPRTDIADRIVYTRVPWGSHETGGAEVYAVQGFAGAVEGDEELIPGVEVRRTSGHSGGHQAIVVRGRRLGASLSATSNRTTPTTLLKALISESSLLIEKSSPSAGRSAQAAFSPARSSPSTTRSTTSSPASASASGAPPRSAIS